MLFDVRVAILTVADTLLDVLHQYLANEVDETHDHFLFLDGNGSTFILGVGSITISSLRIFFQTMPSLVSKKGDFLKMTSKRMHPNAQISASFPQMSFESSSGAM